MKKNEAIVRASKFEQVSNALSKLSTNFFTFYEVKGHSHKKGSDLSYRADVYDAGYIGRIKIELIVSELFLDIAINTIATAAKTEEKGDGIILVSRLSLLLERRRKKYKQCPN